MAVLSILLTSPVMAALGKKEPTADQKKFWAAYSKEIKQANLERHVTALSRVGPRLAGYPGAEKAADYIVSELRKLPGLKDVSSQNLKDLPAKLPYREAYYVTVPWVSGQSTVEVLVKGQTVATYPLFPLWPNLVRTSQLPKEGATFHLVNGGKGQLSSFNGKDMDGTAVLMDFNCGSDWLNAPRLGAKALIFVEPDVYRESSR